MIPLNIDEMKKNLNWDIDKETQKEIIDEFVDLHFSGFDLFESLNSLLQNGRKGTWGNMVKIIASIGFPDNKKYMPILFELLQDLNWSGAEDSMKYLCTINKNDLADLIE